MFSIIGGSDNFSNPSFQNYKQDPVVSLEGSLITSFVDKHNTASPALKTTLLCNMPGKHKVRDDILHELERCDSFSIAVAFITMSGLEPLLMTLQELEKSGIPGRILTSSYLNFSEPKAIRKLLTLKNLQTRIYNAPSSEGGMHTKGYLFDTQGLFRCIIGSSNITANALSINPEWNTRIVSMHSGEFASVVKSQFDALWNDSYTIEAARIIDHYEGQWEIQKKQQISLLQVKELRGSGILAPSSVAALPAPTPNNMQQEFLKRLDQVIKAGAKRALLISATGTGKTYAAAFAAKKISPKRLLFVVHREQIAKQAMQSFKRVLNEHACNFGLLCGGKREYDRKYVFATVQTLTSSDCYKVMDPKAFDLIFVDEGHHSAAGSYDELMEYFKPDFYLGMTGTPDRADGKDVYALFDHNIVYEIRLKTALENNLLCPFHYFGIGSLSVTRADGSCKELETSDFINLEDDEAINYVLYQAAFYGFSGSRAKGLVFCADIKKAKLVAEGFSKRGFPALALTGADSQQAREAAVDRLTGPDDKDALNYIVTVDIFNEGVDLPEVNQIIMLRPTQSPVVFIQQLGRGLRKHDSKEYVVVLDFIGNHDNNFMIPIALYGDRSYSKEQIRKLVASKEPIPGISTVNFDRIAREKIYRAIDNAKTRNIELLKDAYTALKNKLNRIPELMDFEDHGNIDAVKFLEQPRTFYSYHEFLSRYEKDYDVVLSKEAQERITWISRKLGQGKSPSEALVLDGILNNVPNLKENLIIRLRQECGFECTLHHLNSVEAMLTNKCERTKEDLLRNKGLTFIVPQGSQWHPDPSFIDCLNDVNFRRIVQNLVTFILNRWKKIYAIRYRDTMLCLKRLYTYDDVCRLLDWGRLLSAQIIGGYCFDETTKTLPIFINYDKADDAIQYADRFVSETTLISLSKKNRSTDSADAKRMMKVHPYEDTRVHLFVRRNKDDKEAKGFYYLGEMDAASNPKAVELPNQNGGTAKAFEMTWTLREPVDAGLYEYLTGGEQV